MKRHQDFTVWYNAECDKENPRTSTVPYLYTSLYILYCCISVTVRLVYLIITMAVEAPAPIAKNKPSDQILDAD